MTSQPYSGKFNPEETGELPDGSVVPFRWLMSLTPGKSRQTKDWGMTDEGSVTSDFHQEQSSRSLSSPKTNCTEALGNKSQMPEHIASGLYNLRILPRLCYSYWDMFYSSETAESLRQGVRWRERAAYLPMLCFKTEASVSLHYSYIYGYYIWFNTSYILASMISSTDECLSYWYPISNMNPLPYTRLGSCPVPS